MTDLATPMPGEKMGSLRRHAAGFGAMLILALLLAGIYFNSRSAADERRGAEAWYVHTFNVMLVSERLKSTTHGALRGERGYLITADESFLQPYEEARAQTPALVARLRHLTRDNPRQRRNLAALEPRLASYYQLLDRTISLQRSGKGAEAVALVRQGAGRTRIEAVLDILNRVDAEERRLLIERRTAYAEAARTSDMDRVHLSILALLFLIITAGAAVSASRARLRYLSVTEQLNRSATTDELTGLANRRSFMNSLEIELERARRTSRPFAMAILDIDHFKRVNDTYGHQAGDDVLRSVAATLRGAMRATDIIGRLGGEEFGVLMPDTDISSACTACERLRDVAANRPVPLSTGGVLKVTLSGGVALLEEDEQCEHWISRADHALYEAKAGGRNQVKLAA